MPRTATKQNADVVARIDAQIQGVITEIDGQIAQLEEKKSALLRLFGAADVARRGRPPAGAKAAGATAGQKRKVSASTRRKLKEAKKAYWARVRAEKAQAEKAKTQKTQASKTKSEKAAG
jgi:hypothetical protein